MPRTLLPITFPCTRTSTGSAGTGRAQKSDMPDERLTSLHLTIEYAVSRTLQRFKNLQDKDIEWVYEQYRNYFQALRQGKVVAEPDSTRSDRSALMDYLWECLLKWEEVGGPGDLLDGSFRPAGRPVTKVEELYVMGFNDLRKSCRFHRQQSGPRGYVKYVQQWIAECLAHDPELEDLLNPEIPADGGLNFEPLQEKRNYRITLDHLDSEDAAVDALIYDGDGEELTTADFKAFLKRYPNNQLLRAEYAVELRAEDKIDEAIAVWQKLISEAPGHPYYLSAYLDLLLKHDEDLGFDEAERLNFQFELDKYPFDGKGGYTVSTLLNHSSACIRMATMGKDFAYALELFDDLIRTGLPAELLESIGSSIILEVLAGKDEEELEKGYPFQHLVDDFPAFTAAHDFIEGQWDMVTSGIDRIIASETQQHHYPNADPFRPPWPRDPGDVDAALQLRINIIDSEPEIFRTIVVPDDTLLPDLHGMLQVAFDWEECHLHEFIHGGTHYGEADQEAPASEVDYHAVRIGHLLKEIGDEMVYHYDFGDGWKHRIVLEATPQVDDEILYPRCIAGARRGPKEDSGGIHHYQHILKILADPEHPEYADFKDWLGEGFDPEEFVLAWTHKQLWKGRFWNLGGE